MKENGIAPLTWEGKRSAAAVADAEVVDKPIRLDVQGKVAGLLGLSLEDGTHS